MKTSIFCISACLLLAACQSDETPSEPVMKPRADIQLTSTEKLMVTKNNEFALNLFQQIASDKKAVNISISPFSASVCLSMVANGAKGETAAQMYDVLGYKDFSQEEMNAYNKKMCESLLDVDPSTQLALANAIWIKQGFAVKPEFAEVNKTNYNAEVSNLNFTSPNALAVINGWCAKHTNNRIDKILDSLSPNLRLLLANALYFKGIWASKFDKRHTQSADFTNADGSKSRVDRMHQSNAFPYMNWDGLQIAEFPYGNEAFSMIIVLPQNGRDMSKVIDLLVVSKLLTENWNGISKQRLNVALPKFRIEFERELNGDLIAMGMNVPFSDLKADFSGMSDQEPLHIGFVKQKTFIEVNEEGTEAAAVTVTGIDSTSSPSEPTSFVVDKPFIYLIREKSTGAILFMGRIDRL